MPAIHGTATWCAGIANNYDRPSRSPKGELQTLTEWNAAGRAYPNHEAAGG
jgi:hypothetical protein